jgi:hypothetical protein
MKWHSIAASGAACMGALGCPGSVSVQDGDRFGAVQSAAWVSLDLQGDSYHFFLLSTGPELCSRLSNAYEALGPAYTSWEGSSDEEDCDEVWDSVLDAWDPVIGSGQSLMAVTNQSGSFLSGLDAWSDAASGVREVDAGEVDVDLVDFPDGNPYQPLADAEGCPDSDIVEDGTDLMAGRRATDGEVTLELTDSGAWSVEFDLTLDDEAGDAAGTASGSFTAAECEATLDGVDAVEFLLSIAVFAPWQSY